MPSHPHVADHVLNARIQAVRGAGYASALTHPEALAKAPTEFFMAAQARTDSASR